MKVLTKYICLLFLVLFSLASCSQITEPQLIEYEKLTTGALKTAEYFPILQQKNVAVVANHSSLIQSTHLVDSLLARGIKIVKIFSPEHGFRGKASAGEKIQDGKDKKTALPVVSLYGNHKKPTLQDLENVDIVLFDLQDVGVRFYTYISTLTYVMEACAENNIPLIVLDRPNPNGFYVDGPILEPEYKSFVGLHPVPIVYGMTIGEYALMVKGEKWISGQCDLTVIPLNDYQHHMIVKLPVRPSPNLPNWQSIYLYPSLCLFEGTVMSVGRGTDFPFQLYGHPEFSIGSFTFIPEANEGAKHPKFEGKFCYGINLVNYAEQFGDNEKQLNLAYLLSAYKLLNKVEGRFFIDYFEKLAGTVKLRKEIEEGMTEEEIRKSWQEDLNRFKKVRSNYLLYD